MIDGVMMADADSEAYDINKNIVVEDNYYKLTAPALTDMGTGAKVAWSGEVVEDNGSYYAKDGETVTLTITTGEITRTSDPKLTIGGTGATLTAFSGITSNMGGTIPTYAGNVITFNTNETYSAGTITVSLAVASGADKVTLSWGA